ncbi:MAG TPA: nuclear transport factor 2 family protein [Ohtaekwangia sp.]|uniref:nuclear transport factor 2 family protein n=1 Tax=Ohtaekwangia sp. TaxID=2066019 RepID=UPI002F950AB0
MKKGNVAEVKELTPREIVLKFIDALNKHDYVTARLYADDSMKFEGVLGSRSGAEAYFKDVEKMQLQYTLHKVFADDNDVCLLYDLPMSGVTIFCCGWYTVRAGKITSLKVIFDPRPVLEQVKK